MSQESVVVKDPQILGGIPVFRGTRVPAQNLIDYLASGETIDAFLEEFPSVQREAVIQFLQHVGSVAAHEDSDCGQASREKARPQPAILHPEAMTDVTLRGRAFLIRSSNVKR